MGWEGSTAPAAKRCPVCQAINNPTNRFCTHCGHPLSGQTANAETDTPICPSCGAPAAPGRSYCTVCGAPLSGSPLPSPAATKRRNLWKWSALAAVLLLISGGGWWAWQTNLPSPATALITPTPTLAPPGRPTTDPTPTATRRRPTSSPTASPSPTARPTKSPGATPPPTATPHPSPSPTADPVEQAIRETIWRYGEIKAQAVGPAHDESLLDTVLADQALAEQRKAVRWQREYGAYYVTTLHQLRFEWIRRIGATRAQAMVYKVETLLYYPKGWTTPSAKKSCRPCEYRVLYDLELRNGQWYIVEKEVQD
ncbi:MAG TPA: DUF4101 domain-containing protein [Anaerolineae bacterium]|nr:DUF4101 domain-containing protein [Anaerolineae bacterium]